MPEPPILPDKIAKKSAELNPLAFNNQKIQSFWQHGSPTKPLRLFDWFWALFDSIQALEIPGAGGLWRLLSHLSLCPHLVNLLLTNSLGFLVFLSLLSDCSVSVPSNTCAEVLQLLENQEKNRDPHQLVRKRLTMWFHGSANCGFQIVLLVAKCSATRRSVAAPPPGARQGFGGPVHLRHPSQASGMGYNRTLLGGVAATPLLHIGNCKMSRWSATEGGVASAPLR